MKKVIYTSIIGDYDVLEEPRFIPVGYDFICFTDQIIEKPNSIWKIKQVLPLYEDNTRTARKYKILPHRFLPEYDLSIWVDGNELVVGDVNKLQEKYLSNKNMAVYDHISCFDKRNCIYQEYDAIIQLGQQNGSYKDNPQIMYDQVNKYLKEGYPQNNGLISSGVMFRKHNDPQIIKCMEFWWEELKKGSKRDQLSFNYSAWKTKTSFNWINQDIRNDGYVLNVKHNKRK